MSFNKYYQDELSFLREMGKEFAQAHPEAAHFLAEGGSDPDVERLLEGFAFLTGRIRQKIDDELPEATHTLVNLLLPQYLRPIPPISLIEFEPIRGIVRKPSRIPRGTEVASLPVDGTSCRFRTCYDVDVYPFRLESAAIKTPDGARTELQLRFVMEPGCSLSCREIGKLRFFLAGESAETLYFWLCRHVQQVRFRSDGGRNPSAGLYLEKESVQPAGFGREEALFPQPRAAFDGYRLIQEYFTFPEKFLFVDLTGLESLGQQVISNTFEVDFVFSPFVNPSLKISKEDVRLFCSPIVNLTGAESEPLQVDHERTEYRVRPAVPNPAHFEIYSVDRASGWIQGSAEEQEYLPLFSFKFDKADPSRKRVFYHTLLRSGVVGGGTDVYVSFVDANHEEAIPPTETVAFQLTCTNRALAEKLRPGDINAVTENTPAIARFRNITRISPGVRPPLEGDLYWRLMSHLALNYVSLTSAPVFKELLGLYNFQSLENRQAGRTNQFRIEGIVDVQGIPEHLLFRGIPVQGMTTRMALQESHFKNDGDMFLFGSILDEFLSLYVTINSFSRLIVRGADKGDSYEWPPRIGRQIIL